MADIAPTWKHVELILQAYGVSETDQQIVFSAFLNAIQDDQVVELLRKRINHKLASRPISSVSDRELRERRFKAAYQAAGGGHTKRVVAAGRAVGIKERAAKTYAARLGLRAKKNGA